MVVINSVYFKEEDMMSNNLLFFLLSQHYCPQTHFEKNNNFFFIAGDFLKLNFPMASATTNLLWGLIQFHDGYMASGHIARMHDVLRWPLDYFLKCWDPAHNTYYGQVSVKAH